MTIIRLKRCLKCVELNESVGQNERVCQWKEDYILVLFERHKYVLWESLKKKVKKKCKNCSAL